MREAEETESGGDPAAVDKLAESSEDHKPHTEASEKGFSGS